MKHIQRRILILFAMITLVTLNACDMMSARVREKKDLILALAAMRMSTFSDDQNYNSSPNDRAVSRTSGVAPLAVHFFADFVHSASGDERIDRFHHYDYTWDFGDAGSGAWGTTGRSKNMAKGAAAVHIYEMPGDYSITLAIRDHSGAVGTEHYTVSVSDPDTVYSGTNTTCVNNAGDTDYTGAPAGARTVSTDDLSTITQYVTAGSRILFKRGSSWTVAAALNMPDNAGPVTIGAYGTGTNPDALGNYDNAPRITVTGTEQNFFSLDRKQDWRIMDLHLVDPTRSNGSFGGAISLQRQLFLRLKVEGFWVAMGWSHWNDRYCIPLDDMVIASCDVSDSDTNVMYVGSERLGLLGNILRNAQRSHVLRVWQAYRSVIGHNIISGSSINSDSGRHALKLHGPGIYHFGEGTDSLGKPADATGLVNVRTEYTIVADNIFGSSGPWPVCIAPQNAGADERLSNIIFERNRFHPDYGTQSTLSLPVSQSLLAVGRHYTIRNNLFDATGSGNDYCAIEIHSYDYVPAPSHMEVYHNTIYKGDSASGMHRGIRIGEQVTESIVQNNLASFPYTTGPSWTVSMIDNESTDLVSSNNLLTNDPLFMLPGAPGDGNPLARDYRLQAGSPALDQGTGVPVFEDFFMNPRPSSAGDLGAFEQ